MHWLIHFKYKQRQQLNIVTFFSLQAKNVNAKNVFHVFLFSSLGSSNTTSKNITWCI